MEELLGKLGLAQFKPLPFLKSGFLQTVLGAYWPQAKDPGTAELFRVEFASLGSRLGSGANMTDATLVAVDKPANWKTGDPAALLVHGLSGDHLSTYMVRLTPPLVDQGYLVIRMNLRNAGAALGLSQKTYHAGLTTDIRSVLQWMNLKFAPGPITGIGFSLGGNLLLLTAAEDAPQKGSGLARLMVVSPAVDLESASRKLSTYPGKWVAKFFIDQLLRDMDYLKAVHPELQRLKFPKKMSIREFDDVHTSGVHGFRDAGDYYEQCSSLQHIPNIKIPTLIIGSIDDPVVDLEGLAELKLPSNIDLILTQHGGHVGYLGFAVRPTKLRWSDDVLMSWLKQKTY